MPRAKCTKTFKKSISYATIFCKQNVLQYAFRKFSSLDNWHLQICNFHIIDHNSFVVTLQCTLLLLNPLIFLWIVSTFLFISTYIRSIFCFSPCTFPTTVDFFVFFTQPTKPYSLLFFSVHCKNTILLCCYVNRLAHYKASISLLKHVPFWRKPL